MFISLLPFKSNGKQQRTILKLIFSRKLVIIANYKERNNNKILTKFLKGGDGILHIPQWEVFLKVSTTNPEIPPQVSFDYSTEM